MKQQGYCIISEIWYCSSSSLQPGLHIRKESHIHPLENHGIPYYHFRQYPWIDWSLYKFHAVCFLDDCISSADQIGNHYHFKSLNTQHLVLIIHIQTISMEALLTVGLLFVRHRLDSNFHDIDRAVQICNIVQMYQNENITAEIRNSFACINVWSSCLLHIISLKLPSRALSK